MAGYINEPNYCGDCVSFENEANGYGICLRFDEEAWQGEIGCKDFARNEDEGDGN